MTVNDIAKILEETYPLDYAEDFDNVGLLLGNKDRIVSGVLVTLDTLENVVEEAISKNCNLIVSFHPILFKGLKKITGKTYVERVVIKAIANNIAIYSMHTALDNTILGVNAKICSVLGVLKTKILIPKKGTIKKLVTYVPKSNLDNLKMALFDAGAGHIGNYSDCSFSTLGHGSFKPNENARPVVGELGKTHTEEEFQLSLTFTIENQSKILTALFSNHPYEEVAYEVTTLENANQNSGMGMIGELEGTMDEKEFLTHVKNKMNAKGIRHSALLGRQIKRVAVLGGSGAFAIAAAKAANADIYITSDVKYHQFYEADNKIVIADIGHFESEQFTKNLLVDLLTKKIPNFAVTLSESVTNPIKYF